ncbi:MAG: alpha/beta fold hydrolase [Planctomycetaceae bacterium]
MRHTVLICTTLLLSSRLLGPCLICADETKSDAAEKPSPVWYGTMDVGPRVFRFLIEPVKADDGSVSHRLVSLDEGRQAFVLDRFDLTGTSLEFDLNLTRATYAGQRTDDGNVVNGKWKQRGAEFDLQLRKLDAPPVDAPDEVWAGDLNTLLQRLTLRFRVYGTDAESESVFLDSVTQKAGGFKASRTVSGNTWTISVPMLKASFTGTLSDDGKQVDGTFTQAGIPLDLTLSRTELPIPTDAPAPRRPQTPAAPFPYDVEDVVIENTADSVRIAGTLTIPKQAGQVPAVVMISGSGPQDRDESIAGHKPFLVIADHLARHGIAVLRCDDRGVGRSTGNFASATSEDFARDAIAAVDFLQQQARIDKSEIGLIGHSEGGIVAPMVAAQRPDVAFIVLLAGTGVNGEQILLSQGQLILKAAGITDEKTLRAQKAVQTAMVRAVLSDNDQETDDALVARVTEELRTALPDEDAGREELTATVRVGIARLRTPWFRFFLKHEPAPVLKQVKCPVLALNGEKDTQVDPKLNLPAIRQVLTDAGNTDVEVVELPGLNHMFQTAVTGAPGEYAEIEETISASALDAMTTWIRRVTKAGSE